MSEISSELTQHLTAQAILNQLAKAIQQSGTLVLVVLDLDRLLSINSNDKDETFGCASGGSAALPERDLDDVLRKYSGGAG